MSRNRGFTLIELVIVVAIIAILAAIALPSFLAQIRKSRRSEAIGAVQAAALAEERMRADCTAYVDTTTTGWTSTPATGCPPGFAGTLGGNPYASTYYTLKITPTSGTAYTITAAAQGSQANDKAFGTPCSSLNYTYSAGVITKTPSQCWSQ